MSQELPGNCNIPSALQALQGAFDVFVRHWTYLIISTSKDNQWDVACLGLEGNEMRKLDEVHQYLEEKEQAKCVLYLTNIKSDDMRGQREQG